MTGFRWLDGRRRVRTGSALGVLLAAVLWWSAEGGGHARSQESQPADIRIEPLTLTFDRLGWTSPTAPLVGPDAPPSVQTDNIRLDPADPQADFGQVRPDHIVIRFRPSEAARLHAAMVGGRETGAMAGEVPSAVLQGLEGVVESLRPSVAGPARVEAILRTQPALESALTRSAGTPDPAALAALEAFAATDADLRGPLGIFYARLAAGVEPRAASLLLARRPDVVYAHPSPVVTVTATPNDPLYSRMWHLPRIGMPSAWDLSGNSLGTVRVCVVDTGVRIAHNELAGRTVFPVDVYPDDGDAYGDTDPGNDDPDGHGTACAGIVGSIRNNSALVAGIAPVSIIPVNGAMGGGYIANYWDGIYWGVDHGATVVSLSLGGQRSGPAAVELDAMAYAEAHDVLVVAAAGNNDGSADTHYPAAMPYVMSVGAVDDDGIRVRRPRWWWGSNYGWTLDITAPGQGDVGPSQDSILTLGRASNTAYINFFNGTSAATPQVAGVIALLEHINPALTGAQLRAIVEETARDQLGDATEDTPGWDPYHGHGLVDAAAAAAAAAADSRSFTIWNDGDEELYVSSIDVDASAPWLSWSPAAPFTVPGHSAKAVTVRVDRSTAPTSAVTRRLLVSSNDVDESPYPGGVLVTLTCAPAFSKVQPISGSQVSRPTTLSWETSCGATSYEVCVDTLDNGTCDTSYQNVGNVTSVTRNDLSAGTTYSWQVRARNAATTVYANGSGTAFWSFTTAAGTLPDLVVSALTGPSIVAAGATATFADTTLNQGVGAAGPTVTGFYFSTNSSWSQDDVPVGSRSVSALAPGAMSAGSTVVTIPAGRGPGRYYLLAKADATGAHGETSETNNVRSRSIYIGPDLVVSAITGPSVAMAGGTIAVTDTTGNQGTAPAGASTTRFFFSANTKLDASDVSLGARAVGGLAALAASAGTTTLTVPPGTAAGKFYVLANADDGRVVTEANEGNNIKSKVVYVGPDLTVPVLKAPATVTRGVGVAATVETGNSGGAAASPSTTRVYVSLDKVIDGTDTLLATISVPTLMAGAVNRVTPTITIPAGVGAGTRYLIAVADAGSAVFESREDNNQKTRTITVQ